MPTYVYRRTDGTVFETFQKISDPPLTTDPETGDPVQRVISGGAGLQFKGTGFYLTDYGRGGQPSKASDSAPDKSSSKASDSGATSSSAETKASSPAPKAENS